MIRRLLPIALLCLTAPAQGQSIDRILAAAAERAAARDCTPAGQNEVVVCGDRDRDDRYRLPLPNVRDPAEAGAVAGEVPPPSVENPFLSGCGLFRGQRRCGKLEMEAYGYGRGRDPVTLLGRLVTRAVDPDAEVGPAPTVP
ncbi:hypothetical protein QLH51_18740 [Sphingomonas sp. 2R-10]|uniref:hypothetical protein n=1 Tax=Sphingomonas sp. 2R-10 TaxID=3045148 RepID=UPI000F78F28B|nr:hypothetical protein [Sphingomonas sp. 2R-10]MDJ0278834.1 hypothetical protein [Sphingomonas sp. 2R-10]